MLCAEIIEPGYPTLNFAESTTAEALALQARQNILSLPVLEDDELRGILPVKEILTLPEKTEIHSLQNLFIKASVPEKEHFLSAFKIMSVINNIVPVIDAQGKYRGTVTQASLLSALNVFLDIQNSAGGIIVLEMNKIDYSFSEISRLVESNDANISQLNTYFDVKAESFMVTLKISRGNVSDIVATFQRYDYHVVYYSGEESYENEIKRNYDALMNYLSI